MMHHHEDNQELLFTRSEAIGWLSSDSEFLLRCAHTHNWEVLIDFCSFLEETFTSAVPERLQSRQADQFRNAERQLLAKDQWGNNALIAACFMRPPLSVISALLDAASCGMAASLPAQMLQHQARDGSRALQVACACGASWEVVRLLLYPPSGLLPESPIFLWDNRLETPLTDLVVCYARERQSPGHTNNPSLENLHLLQRDHDDESGSFPPLLEDLWKKVETILRAAWSTAVETSSGEHQELRSPSFVSMVHAMSYMSHACPTVLMDAILRSYPHMIGYPDRHGVLPLHVALTMDPVWNVHIHHPLIARRTYWIQRLIHLYPKSVLSPVPLGGRSTLCQALASKFSYHLWDDTIVATDEDNKNSKSSSSLLAPVGILVQQHAQLCAMRDVVTGLYPFQLAALPFTEESPFSSTYDCVQIDTIYNLLRVDPNLLCQT